MVESTVGSLERKKRIRLIAAAAALVLLLAVIVGGVLTPSPEEEEGVAAFTTDVLAADPQSLPRARREALRQQWERFSPETRRAVFTEVARTRLEAMREHTRGLTPEQRAARIAEAVAQMRTRRRLLDPTERARIRGRLTSQDGREMVDHVLRFYQTELSAKERAELDPLVHEWLAQLAALGR